MSADGYGILGMAAIAIVATPVLIGGAIVVGTIYAAGKLVNHIDEERQRNNALREQREAELRERLATEEAADRRRIQEIMSSYSRLQDNQISTRQALYKQTVELYKAFANEIRESQERTNRGVNVLVKNTDENRRKLVASWAENINNQADSYSKSVHNALSEMKDRIHEESDRFNQLRTQLTEDSQLKEFAVAQLQEAQIIMKTVRIELGLVPESVVEGYNRAVAYFNKGMFENTYGVASSVILECYDVLEKGIIEHEKKVAFAEFVEMQIVDMRSRIEAIREFQFDYNNEKYEEDLLRFNPFFNGIFSRLNEVNGQIKDIEGLDIYSLSRIQKQLSDLDLDISDCIKTAVQRLVFAYAENDTASNITEIMNEQGYDVDGYAYESGQEGQPIHINFKGRVSGDDITVILSPEEINDTRRIRVSVHDYGVNGEADSRRQDEIRNMIENALNIPISCSNRGHVSSNVQAADLQAVEDMHFQ